MAKETLDFQIKIGTTGAEALGIIKKELKEANGELIKAKALYGDYSQEAINAAKKVAELRDRIGDTKALTESFNPDAKFRALTSSLAGVAGGFAAIQGGLALFGVESDNVQKSLLKVQSAMALSQGLQSVGESIDSFKNLGTVIKSTSVYQAAYNFIKGDTVEVAQEAVVSIEAEVVALEAEAVATTQVAVATTGATIAMRIFRAALIATGIGAVVVLLGFLIEKYFELTGATNEARKAQEALNKSFVEGKKKAYTDYLDTLDNLKDIELARVADDENAKFKIEESYRKQKIAALNKHYSEILGKDADAESEILKQKLKLQTEGTIKEIENTERLKKEKTEANKKKVEDNKKEAERNQASIKANQEFELKIQQDLLKLDEENAAKKRAIEFQNMENLISDLDYKNGLLDNDFAEDQQRLANKEAYIAEQKSIELSNLNLSEKERLDIIEKYAVKERQIDKDITTSKKEEKKAQVKETINLMGQLTDFVGKDTAAGKALGIATATINTYQGASEALKQKSTLPSPFDVIAKIANVATIIATGIKTVKTITSVPVPNGGGGGGSMPSLSSISPIMPELPIAQITQLSQQSINDIGNNAVRAYVVESDVTSSQQRITAIRQRARFS